MLSPGGSHKNPHRPSEMMLVEDGPELHQPVYEGQKWLVVGGQQWL